MTSLHPPPRPRIAAALAMVITTGVASRIVPVELPSLLAKDLGDFLWAVMFYLIVLLVHPRLTPLPVALIVYAIASATELFKLYHGPWIQTLRDAPIGGFLLGRTFHAENFITYALGAAAAYWMDMTMRSRQFQRRP